MRFTVPGPKPSRRQASGRSFPLTSGRRCRQLEGWWMLWYYEYNDRKTGGLKGRKGRGSSGPADGGLEASTVSPPHTQHRSTVPYLHHTTRHYDTTSCMRAPAVPGLPRGLLHTCLTCCKPTHNFPVDMPDRPAGDSQGTSIHVLTLLFVRQGRGVQTVLTVRCLGWGLGGLVARGKSLSLPTESGSAVPDVDGEV